MATDCATSWNLTATSAACSPAARACQMRTQVESPVWAAFRSRIWSTVVAWGATSARTAGDSGSLTISVQPGNGHRVGTIRDRSPVAAQDPVPRRGLVVCGGVWPGVVVVAAAGAVATAAGTTSPVRAARAVRVASVAKAVREVRLLRAARLVRAARAVRLAPGATSVRLSPRATAVRLAPGATAVRLAPRARTVRLLPRATAARLAGQVHRIGSSRSGRSAGATKVAAGVAGLPTGVTLPLCSVWSWSPLGSGAGLLLVSACGAARSFRPWCGPGGSGSCAG